jgi:hypothetical protein
MRPDVALQQRIACVAHVHATTAAHANDTKGQVEVEQRQ